MSHSVKEVVIESSSSLDLSRSVANQALGELGDVEYPLMLMDVSKVELQYMRWARCMPSVEVFYAAKCNTDRVLLKTLFDLGASFDCATAYEMDVAVKEIGQLPGNIIYSNPCKLASHLRHAHSLGIRMTIADNKDEILKIHKEHPSAQVLIRLACSDSSAQCPMSCKFGAPLSAVRELMDYALEIGVEVIGIDFHVGSGCQDPRTYERALIDARRAFDIGLELGHDMTLLDIGGGFPGLDPMDGLSCKTTSGYDFEEIATAISACIDQLFLSDPSRKVRVIGEPGRFFASGAGTLITKIHSKCAIKGSSTQQGFRYYINDGLYGSFNCVLYDHQHVTPFPLDKERAENAKGREVPAVVFGPTCDGFDKVMDPVTTLPEMFPGERLIWPGMGAYTTAAATTFNGFPTPQYYYYRSRPAKLGQ